MNKEIFKNKKFWIICGVVLAVIIISIIIIFAVKNKNDNNNDENSNNTSSSINENSKTVWPNLEEYDISKLNKGKIDNVIDESNMNGHKINYTIDVDNISKEDIEEYVESFKDWTVNKSDYYYILVKSTDEAQYSIVITFDEEKNTAQFAISSI